MVILQAASWVVNLCYSIQFIHANLALKERVPPQSRTSPHVTVKNIYSIQPIRASASCSKILNLKIILNTVKNFRENSVFHSLYWICIFYLSGFWTTCACPENRVFPEIFHCIKYSFYIKEFWTVYVCPEKQSVPWIHCIEYIFFTIQNCEQHALALKNRICTEIFHCIEIFFIFQNFWATWACPENRVCPEFFNRGGGRPPPRTPLLAHAFWVSVSFPEV